MGRTNLATAPPGKSLELYPFEWLYFILIHSLVFLKKFIITIILTLQYCIGFAIHQHESQYTRVPNPEPLSHLPPHPIPLGYPSAPAPSIQYPASNLDW